jgi:multidrug transporter EmrE-like cation transporter
MKHAALLVLLFSIVFNAAGQVFWKSARLVQPDASLLELFLHYQTWVGFALYGLSALCWLWVLSRAQLSYAYPILALSYPIVVGLSALLFTEAVSILRWIGVAIIVIGVSLLART